jgi:hypothetical protein
MAYDMGQRLVVVPRFDKSLCLYFKSRQSVVMDERSRSSRSGDDPLWQVSG